MGKPSVLDDPPNDSTAGKGYLHAMLQTDLPAVVTLDANKNANTGNVARRSSSSRLNQTSVALFCKNFCAARSIYLRASAPEARPPPPVTGPVVSVLPYRRVRVDGRL